MKTTDPDSSGSLRLQSLELHHFRNYEFLSLDNLGSLSIFVGANATGKTNIIEAIQLMTALKSFRATHMEQLVKWGEEKSLIKAYFSNGTRTVEERLELEAGKRKYFYNGKPKNMSDLLGLIPSVSFNPDDLNLVKGSNTQRRSSVDGLGTQLSKNFRTVKQDYQKLIKQKNQALKEEFGRSYIESINEVLSKVGAQLFIHRLMVLQKLVPCVKASYERLSGRRETIDLEYRPRWVTDFNHLPKEELQRALLQALDDRMPEELARKKSVVGPHTDELFFLVDGNDAVHFASQGQQRSIVLAYKMAEMQVIEQTLERKPLLLLDDVMSELDESRRDAFMDLVKQENQTFITTTTLGYFSESAKDKSSVYKLPFTE